LCGSTKSPAFDIDGIGANGVAVDDELVTHDGGSVGQIGIAAIWDLGIVPFGVQRPAVVRDANVQLGKRLGFVAQDSDIFVGGQPSDVLGFVALLAEGTVFVGVIYPIDHIIGAA
jgi:hypothetical protein